jgi:hypothetical protein
MIRALLSAFAFLIAIASGSTIPAAANTLDSRPYTTLPECPGVRQYVGIVNDYRRKKRSIDSVSGLIERLVALGDKYRECAASLGASHIVDPETAAPGQHRIAAEAALVYYDALQQWITIIDVAPKSRRAKGADLFVATGHAAIVDAKYVLDRSDDDVDKAHAKTIVTNVGAYARKYYPKKYDEIMELKPDDIRT